MEPSLHNLGGVAAGAPWVEGEPAVLTESVLRAYRAATVPAGFSIALNEPPPLTPVALSALCGRGGVGAYFARLPGLPALLDSERLLHVAEDTVIQCDVEVGTTLIPWTRVESWAKAGRGYVVRYCSELRDSSARAVAVQRTVLRVRVAVDGERMGGLEIDGGEGEADDEVVRAVGLESGSGSRAAEALCGEPVVRAHWSIPSDQAARYADASGDHTAVHLDAKAARRFGMRRPPLHGLCTLAMVQHALGHELPAAAGHQWQRVWGTFQHPVYMGDALECRAWCDGSRVRFEVTSQSGETLAKTVLTGGGCLVGGS